MIIITIIINIYSRAKWCSYRCYWAKDRPFDYEPKVQ